MINKKVLIAVAALGGGYYLNNNDINFNNLFLGQKKEEEEYSSRNKVEALDIELVKPSLFKQIDEDLDEETYLPEIEIEFVDEEPRGQVEIQWEENKNKICLEEMDIHQEKSIQLYNIGEKTNYVPYIDKIKVVGGKRLSNYTVIYSDIIPELSKENYGNKKYFKIKAKGEKIKIDSKKKIIKKFNEKFDNRYFIENEDDLELIYYLPQNDTQILIPMYQIGNPKSGALLKNSNKSVNVLGLIFPANEKYNNNFDIKITNVIRNRVEVQKQKEQEKDEINDSVNIKNNFTNEYTIEFESPGTKMDRINFIGNLKNISKDLNKNRSVGKYRFKYQQIDSKKNESVDKVLVNYVNEYDVSKTVLVDLVSSRDNNEYGISWGEDVIGGACYSNYVNYMDTKAINNYKWTKPNAWVSDFIDKQNNGFDHLYVDAVDISTYIGHGNGYGFNFEGNTAYPANGSLTYEEAAKGNAWGNKDVEYQVWLSCQVLENVYDNKKWWQRWGPTFNGLHLICGFQTNASTGTHRQLRYFAENIYDRRKTVRESWIDAANNDQPNGTQAVIMGPLIRKEMENIKLIKQKQDYNTIDASTPGMLRAHWNDKAYDLNGPDKKDIPKSLITGFWRIVHTV
jgi:hypothetical protein